MMTAAILISEGNHEKSAAVDWRGTPIKGHAVYLNHKVGLAVVRLESP